MARGGRLDVHRIPNPATFSVIVGSNPIPGTTTFKNKYDMEKEKNKRTSDDLIKDVIKKFNGLNEKVEKYILALDEKNDDRISLKAQVGSLLHHLNRLSDAILRIKEMEEDKNVGVSMDFQQAMDIAIMGLPVKRLYWNDGLFIKHFGHTSLIIHGEGEKEGTKKEIESMESRINLILFDYYKKCYKPYDPSINDVFANDWVVYGTVNKIIESDDDDGEDDEDNEVEKGFFDD